MIELDIRRIDYKIGRPFIIKNHYSHGCHKNPTCYGGYHNGILVAVAAYATPCSENVRSWFFGSTKEQKDKVTELHRLFMLDEDEWPCRCKNALSFFTRQTLNLLVQDKPLIRCVVSFADQTEEHVGSIYRALNFMYFGTTGKRVKFWYDEKDDRLHHPRQNGINITNEDATARGWVPVRRERKHKYAIFVGDKRQIKESKRLLLHQPICWEK